MSESKLEVTCPCCEAKLHIDSKTGEVLWQEEKPKEHGSINDILAGHKAKQKESETLFQKQSELQKERNRILEEKFKEAQKHADKSPDKPLRDFDLD